jgi:glycosyltransferase involved in cell wall biosynthesis
MHVLLFNESAGPGGAERVVLTLAVKLQTLGVKVSVATLRAGWLTNQLAEKKITHFLIPSVSKKHMRLAWRLYRILSSREYDIVHSHLVDSNFYASIAAFFARIPHIATEHGDVHHTKKKRALQFKCLVIGQLATRIAAVSEFTKNALIALGVPEKKVKVIGNPVSIGLTLNENQKQGLRKIIGVDETTWVWLHVASLRAVKNQSTLLHAFKETIEKNARPQSLLIAGSGPEEGNLKALAETLGISKKVFFLGFREDTEILYQIADCFLLTSHSEALPISALEAGLAKCPVLTTSVGGLPSLLAEQRGFLSAPDSPSHFSKEMLSVLNDENEAKRRGELLFHYVTEHFSAETIAKKYLELYRGFTRRD